MVNILFAKTFLIVGGMLFLTALTAKINRFFETSFEMWSTFIISFLLLFLILGFSNDYPLNLILVAAFSLVIGWLIGPAIERFGMRYKLRMYLKSNGIVLKKGESATDKQMEEFEKSFDKDAYHKEWQNVIFQAVMGTALAVVATASIVFLTDIDFSFLGGFLFISLIILIIMGLINTFFIRSKLFSLIRAYLGAVVFTFYLLYDFNYLQSKSGDESWSTAINISVNIYLDIINLFLDLLEILSESN
ncbi:Bax inhibitor-1 family protein [Halarcobacter sp.]|uniref:Bax inhibitor-1 family protein n=1 Tax=Halarcobacter sp. TaxID=2321133 RepID=UPI0029F47272|nr:Bax inhibitor-1 family protein [Halarcobacter sp.]